ETIPIFQVRKLRQTVFSDLPRVSQLEVCLRPDLNSVFLTPRASHQLSQREGERGKKGEQGTGRKSCVFRNQLPRKNDHYSYEPPSEEPPDEEDNSLSLQLRSGVHLCWVCGCLGPKVCSKCHKAHYCSKDHQTLDWKLGHKQSCTTSDNLNSAIPDHEFLFPEYEVVIETEDMEPDSVPVPDCIPEGLEKCENSELIGNMDEALEAELDSIAKHESKEDKIFQKFKTHIALEPDQILRYGRGIDPIWISGENIPQEQDIPNCPCGARRIFEFQVMPQLLNYLKADRLGRSIDWGTLAVFTCVENCNLGTKYKEEFIWKQDFTEAT
uniref:Programmed cell death protein 2 n=1 Tax=Vombatus ursinus TaxID=29139 RepID=A0A4X2LKJ0_VOMUR